MFSWNARLIRKLLFRHKKTSVLTGGFQLLHFGHLNIIRRAAALGELTILLNSDRGILQRKGYLAEGFETRKKNLLATGLVKRVLKFDTDPTTLICVLKPDYYVLGSDYTKEIAMQTGGKYAGEIVIVPYTKGISSSKLYKGKVKHGEYSRDKPGRESPPDNHENT